MDFVNGFPITSSEIDKYNFSKKEIVSVLNKSYFE